MNLFELSAKISVDDTNFKKSMGNAQKVSKNVANAMKELQSPLDKAKSGFNAIAHPVETVKANIEKLKNATEEIRHPIETFKNKVADASAALETKRNKLSALAAGYDSAKKKVADITKEFNKSAKESGTSSQKTQELAKKLNEAEKEAEEAKKELDDYSASVSKAGKNSDSASKGVGNFASKLGKGIATAGKIGVAAVGAAAAGVAALTTAAVNNYAEYEQLVGGVETLFKNSAGKVQEYAANAYKTAGMSANEYMSTVTSFSASLLQSLGGDTDKAAEYANQALTDMSDNANKMGTSMEMIQNAYQGFAKQNYTMLDNLKLGYGGTKEEMARLIEDAAKLSDTVDAQDMSFGNIVKAINVVQTELGITGTTALEAGRTISGAVGSMKSAWANLLTGLADGNADISELVNNLVTTIVGDGSEENLGVFGNIMPAVETALAGASTLIGELLPEIVQLIPTIITDNLPILAEAAISVLQALIDGVGQNQEMLMTTALEIITYLANSFVTMLPQIDALGFELIVSLAKGISENLPQIIPNVVGIYGQIMTTLTENLPLLISSALEIIVSLANGIAGNLPELIPAIIEVMMKIVETLTEPETLSNLLDAALVLLTALAYGLMDAIPALVDATLEIIEKLVEFLLEPENITKLLQAALEIVLAIGTGLVSSIPQILESVVTLVGDVIDAIVETDWAQVGEDIVNGLLKGLQDMWSSLTGWFSKAWDGLVGGVKDFLGIHSPSRVFAGIGKNMALGVGEGWGDEFDGIKSDIDKSLDFDDPTMNINASVRRVGTGTVGGHLGGTTFGNVTININGAKYNDENALADVIAERLQMMTDRRSAVYA